jgi:hypothetical protein
MKYTTKYTNEKKSNIQFDIYDPKNRQLGVEISTYNKQNVEDENGYSTTFYNEWVINPSTQEKEYKAVDHEFDNKLYYVAEIQQTRNNKNFGGSYAYAKFETETELNKWIEAKVPSLQKNYAKKFAEKAVA